MSRGGNIIEKHADLTILDLPCRPTILHLNASRFAASLGEAGLVNRHNGIIAAEPLQDVGAQVITYQVSIPDCLGEKALHTIWSGFSGMFGQLPPIFARHFAQQSLQIQEGPATRFWPSEVGSNAGMQMRKRLCPLCNLAGGRLLVNWYAMLVVLHNLLLFCEISEISICFYRMSYEKEKFMKLFSCLVKAVSAQLKSATVVTQWSLGTSWLHVGNNWPHLGNNWQPLA
jgi:hypothetical protein